MFVQEDDVLGIGVSSLHYFVLGVLIPTIANVRFASTVMLVSRRRAGSIMTVPMARGIGLYYTSSVHPPAEVLLVSTSAFCRVASQCFSETRASLQPNLGSHGETHIIALHPKYVLSIPLPL